MKPGKCYKFFTAETQRAQRKHHKNTHRKGAKIAKSLNVKSSHAAGGDDALHMSRRSDVLRTKHYFASFAPLR
jgi:hypothetical protein